MGSVMAIAHRGASAVAPENTLAAFEEALRVGCRAIECDVRLSADGVPIILHDETLNRTTNGRGPAVYQTAFDLRRYDAGSWMHPRFAGIRIPTLEEALRVIMPGAMPVLELKVPVDPAVLEHLLSTYGELEDALIISFQADWLAPVRRRRREFQIGLLADSWTDDLPERCRALGAETLILNVDALSIPHVLAADGAGLELWCYTANDIGLVAACAAMGVSGIITDRPDLIRET